MSEVENEYERKHRSHEVEETAKALRHEGKIDKDTYDWFSKEYARLHRLDLKKARHEQNQVHSLGA